MTFKFYTIPSPGFLTKSDFVCFALWCEWHDSSELDELRWSGVEESYIEDHFLRINADGRDVYYPILSNSLSPTREFTFARSSFSIGNDTPLDGYLSLVRNSVVAATIWMEDTQIEFLRHDRFVASETNLSSTALVCKTLKLDSLSALDYNSNVKCTSGSPLSGRLEIQSQTTYRRTTK